MDKTGYIEIKITGSKGNLELTPDSYDIREIRFVLEKVEDLIYPGEKRNRPIITYQLENGSIRHIFKTSIQYVIGFNAVMGQVAESKSIDFLDISTSKAFESMQEIANKKNYEVNIQTSINNSNEIKINKDTRYYRSESLWVDAEFYFYGKITNAGGKDKANVHIYTDENKSIIIQTPISCLEKFSDNILYKTYGIRAIGKQHSETGEIDTSTLKFVELINYKTNYDEEYINSLRKLAKKSWLGKINTDKWLREIRGGYDT